MVFRTTAALLLILSLATGCSRSNSRHQRLVKSHHADGPPVVLAVYEAWFGHPSHISVGYSSHDPALLRSQMRKAKDFGITGFVVDWYGYREPFINESYALMQKAAADENFHIAMMYDESNDEDTATDETIEDFKLFRKTYLAADAAGRQAYLVYDGRPVIFIFPKGLRTDWSRVRAEVDKWQPAPLLIDEYPPGKLDSVFDGYYAWISPGSGGWAADGSHWGEQYLTDFYKTMASNYPDQLAIGGVWSNFDDSKASWGLNRHISARCGQTFADTVKLWHQYASAGNSPYVLVETWNDYEEGTALEKGVPTCAGGTQPPVVH